MKCKKCGFIFNGERDTCPYCGNKVNESPANFLHSSTSLTQNTSIKNMSILCIIIVNLFAVMFFIDWGLGFTYKLTLISFFVCMGLLTILVILYRRKTTLSIYMSIDIFLIFLIFCASLFGNVGSVDLTGLLAGVILPAYIVLSTFGMIIAVLANKNKGYSPVGLVAYLVFKFLVGLTLFILGLIYFNSNGSSLSFFDCSNLIQGVESTQLVRALCIAAFAVNTMMLVNSLVLLFYKVANNIRKFYGNK